MKDISYKKARNSSENTAEVLHKADIFIDSVKSELIKKYLPNNENLWTDAQISLSRQLIPLFSVVPDLEGKRILDLACGSNYFRTSSGGVFYEPWLCRALYSKGYNPVGIDANTNVDEEFENYGADLENSYLLNFLSENQFDIANLGGFYNLQGINIEKINENLRPQLEKLLKPEGIFLYQEL